MAGLKNNFPEMALSGARIAPEEIDRYEQYVVAFPSYSSTWFGTLPVAGTAATGTLVVINAIADYPRNAEFALAGSATGMAGTFTLYGYNQFGVYGSEAFGFGSTDNGGTVVGTKIFASISAGTLSFGTAVGNGTARLGVGTLGTTTLFGLPAKIGGTTDVKVISKGGSVGMLTVNGGTIAAFVDAVQHAIKAPTNVVSANIISVIYKPTYDASADTTMTNLSQRV
jgi:hypothetical protein